MHIRSHLHRWPHTVADLSKPIETDFVIGWKISEMRDSFVFRTRNIYVLTFFIWPSKCHSLHSDGYWEIFYGGCSILPKVHIFLANFHELAVIYMSTVNPGLINPSLFSSGDPPNEIMPIIYYQNGMVADYILDSLDLCIKQSKLLVQCLTSDVQPTKKADGLSLLPWLQTRVSSNK